MSSRSPLPNQPPSPARRGRPARTVADRQLMQEAGRRLRWVREAIGRSQAEMAETIGVHQTAWSLYERGARWPDAFEAVRIMAKLGISREYLLDGSLQGVQPELAIRLAARHPELADTVSMDLDKGSGEDRAP